MSGQKNDKHRRTDHSLKSLPSEVLLKARSTLFSLGGALKSRNDSQKPTKQDAKGKKSQERLKNVRSEPEFGDVRKSKHRSRADNVSREYGGVRPRPLSVGALKRYEDDGDFPYGSFPKDMSLQRQFESSEEICVQSRLILPVSERLGQDIQIQDSVERPRKKLSFREPEIMGGSSTLGRSNKLMGVNSLTKRPNRVSLRSDTLSSLDGMDSDLESQAMRIVRTVGQAFEVCHKMQVNSPDQPAPSTSSAPDEQIIDHVSDVVREPTAECGVSETGAASTSKAEEPMPAPSRPTHLELLPPPPKKESRRNQHPATVPTINLPDLPECVTKVEVTLPEGEAATPLSAQHQLQLLQERLEQQAQQTRAAVAQLLLLRDQLAAEQAARCEAQARTHQLLVHNKDLLEHIAALVAHLQEREKGNSRPISAQQLTLLPQKIADGKESLTHEIFPLCNGSYQPRNEAVVNHINQANFTNHNPENNNLHMPLIHFTENANSPSSAPNFGGMSNEQIQNYLISKFQDMEVMNNKQSYQNSNAFPNIPPLTNHYSNSDIASLMNHQSYKENHSSNDDIGNVAQAMSIGQSQNSLYSNSQPTTTSNDSSPDGASSDESIPFIMPLSHKGTLTATGNDGRVRLIVPVSPSESFSEIGAEKQEQKESYAVTLKVPTLGHSLAPTGPITRTTSEKVPNHSEMMTAVRAQWARHTTK